MQRFLLVFISLTFLMFCAVTAFGQTGSTTSADSEYVTVVVLTSGGTLTGKIVEDHPGDKLVLERADGRQFDIPYKKIAAISRNGELSEQRLQQVRDSIRTAPTTRMRPWIQVHLFVAAGDATTDLGGQGSIGTMLTPSVYVGGGLGYEMDNDNTVSFLPLYAEIQYLVGQTEFTPMFYGRGGYSLGWLDGIDGSDHGGVRLEAGAGILRTFSEDRNGMFLQMGYVSQKISNIPIGTEKTSDTRDFVKVAIGVAF